MQHILRNGFDRQFVIVVTKMPHILAQFADQKQHLGNIDHRIPICSTVAKVAAHKQDFMLWSELEDEDEGRTDPWFVACGNHKLIAITKLIQRNGTEWAKSMGLIAIDCLEYYHNGHLPMSLKAHYQVAGQGADHGDTHALLSVPYRILGCAKYLAEDLRERGHDPVGCFEVANRASHCKFYKTVGEAGSICLEMGVLGSNNVGSKCGPISRDNKRHVITAIKLVSNPRLYDKFNQLAAKYPNATHSTFYKHNILIGCDDQQVVGIHATMLLEDIVASKPLGGRTSYNKIGPILAYATCTYWDTVQEIVTVELEDQRSVYELIGFHSDIVRDLWFGHCSRLDRNVMDYLTKIMFESNWKWTEGQLMDHIDSTVTPLREKLSVTWTNDPTDKANRFTDFRAQRL